jgi:hypothetical protein
MLLQRFVPMTCSRSITVAARFLGVFLLTFSSQAALRPRVALTGAWDFYADVGDATLGSLTNRPGKIIVPGAWQAQGYGTAGGTIPSANIGPGTSPAEYLRHNLMARCLYFREVSVPADWQGQRVFLCVRRAYRYTDVTVNGKRVGEYEGFCSPFEFDITQALSFGSPNQLVIGVDNRPRPGRDTLGTGNLYGNWGGIGGAVYLEARAPIWVEDVFAIPRIKSSTVDLRVTLGTTESVLPNNLRLQAEVRPWTTEGAGASAAGETSAAVNAASTGEQTVTLPVSIADARLWTPEHPFLYTARVRLSQQARPLDELVVRFGLREITAEGRKLLLNGKPLYLSGYGDDATEPLTGMLPADKAVYEKRLKLMRSLGFNFVRHHSCVPHDEYLDAADEAGMLVQPEAGLAYTGFWRTGRRLFEQEWPAMVKAFRNHPSLWAWCMGNELFLNEFPERETSGASDLSQPLTNGPLRTVAVQENGVFGPLGQYPTQSFKQSNYYRDVGALVDGKTLTLLGEAKTERVFTDAPHELGLKIIATADTPITRIRYYRVREEKGAHVGRLWRANGTELAQVTFANESASGWQEASFPTPVLIKAGQEYAVSVNANAAYAATSPGPTDCTRDDVLKIVAAAYRQAKTLDPTRLIHASDGGTLHEFTDIFSSGGGDKFGAKPLLLHEYGTYCCSLPDFTLIPRLNGVMRPLTYERAERYVREHHLEEVYPRLLRSSLLMRAEAQKQYMESAKASGANQGYSFWLGIDFPESPEGCWDEGILNELWEPKPFLTNGLIHLNGPTVLLTSVGLDSRSFYADEEKLVPLRLWHYGEGAITGARLRWRVLDGTTVLQSGVKEGIVCGEGEVLPLQEAVLKVLAERIPHFVTLDAAIEKSGRLLTENSWDFYCYPRVERAAAIPGVYSEAGAIPGAVELRPGEALPKEVRVLITRELKRERHAVLLSGGKTAVLLLGTGGFKEHKAGYFLNQYGAGYGAIIEEHPVFAGIPHEGRIHPGLYQLVAGGGLLNAEEMPQALREGAVVWGLQLTGWISPVKNLNQTLHWSEVITENQLHLVLCSFDLLSNKPESQYVLGRTIDYLLAGKPCALAKRCATTELMPLLR